MAQQSFKHHYVPDWYQRRFLSPGQTTFKILDMHPPKFPMPDGTARKGREILDKGPKAFFFEKDLYTVRWFGQPNDDIERMLFGAIDCQGRRAIEAYITQDWNTIHQTYWAMYEFMDALRLRTPKGLQFLKLVYQTETQNQLMLKMQQLRRMHCVMWAESVLEIISAEQSSVKFIFSDHPVTLFNRFVFPRSTGILKGRDPLLDWMGTQTLFPFDKDRLFVLTHLQWAQSPGGSNKAKTKRTNARYFDNPLVRYDKCIRERSLSEQQVREVNYIIKMRAHRYIAGSSEDDLFPERHLKTLMWNKLGNFLLPTHRLYEFGGNMTVMKNDGSYYFQDEFGQRPKSKSEHESLEKKAKRLKEHMDRIISKHNTK